MLIIKKQFEIGVPIQYETTIKNKLAELNIVVMDRYPYRTKIVVRDLSKIYLFCMGREEDIKTLIDHLTNELRYNSVIIL